MIQPGSFLTVAEWSTKHSWPPIGGLRHLIKNAETNGFDAVIRRSGRRILLSELAFYSWLDQQRSAK